MSAAAVVHVIDDDSVVRDSLDFLLRSHDIATRTYESANSFLSKLSSMHGGCIITDVRMPGVSGVELLRRLNKLQIKLPVIVITGHGDLQLAVEAMKLGAVDFLEKPFDGQVLIAAVRSALDRWHKGAVEHVECHVIQERLAILTQRERDVLQGLLAGNSNKLIARELDISPRTVEIYRANVMSKMKAGSLSDLVRMAIIARLMGTASVN
jgi:two-component system, LuxR family, response regulator FixJ